MWQERGLTMVFVTHDSSVARRAQRIGVMKNGRLTIKRTIRPAPAQAAPAQQADAPDLAPDSVTDPEFAPD